MSGLTMAAVRYSGSVGLLDQENLLSQTVAEDYHKGKCKGKLAADKVIELIDRHRIDSAAIWKQENE
jgi:hypothetical protein